MFVNRVAGWEAVTEDPIMVSSFRYHSVKASFGFAPLGVLNCYYLVNRDLITAESVSLSCIHICVKVTLTRLTHKVLI